MRKRILVPHLNVCVTFSKNSKQCALSIPPRLFESEIQCQVYRSVVDRGTPANWQTLRRKVYRRDGYTCQNCGATGGPRGNTQLEAHHIVPKEAGGTHELSNLKTLCKSCHDAVHGRRKSAPTARSQFSRSKRRRIRRLNYRKLEFDWRSDWPKVVMYGAFLILGVLMALAIFSGNWDGLLFLLVIWGVLFLLLARHL